MCFWLLKQQAVECNYQQRASVSNSLWTYIIYSPDTCLFLTVREASYCLLGGRQCREVIPPCNDQAENEKVPGLGWESHSPPQRQVSGCLVFQWVDEGFRVTELCVPWKGAFVTVQP